MRRASPFVLARAARYARGLGGCAMLAALSCSACAGTTLREGGHVSTDARAYFGPARFADQKSGNGLSLRMEPELSVQSESEEHTVTLHPFIRMDPADEQRTHYDLRQADYVFATGPLTTGVGVGLFSWGVLEAHKLVDIINQSDLVEDIGGSEKLGQPYVGSGLSGESWSLRALYLPYSRDRTFPGDEGRLRFPLVVDTDQPQYESSLARFHPGFAGRGSISVGELDLGLSAFAGLSREPRFYAQLTERAVIPRYEQLRHVGVDAQWTHEALSLKLEATARTWSTTFRPSAGIGGGLEYSFFDIGPFGYDLTLVGEYYWDNRPLDAPVTLYDHDAFGGFRFALNDDSDTMLLAGMLVDVDTGFSSLQVSASRRLGERWRLFLEGRGFFGPEGILESSLLSDDYAQLRVAYYF
ncbi:MAG: hypothetical protein R3B13_17125 [Polyangiaceae bacterium]